MTYSGFKRGTKVVITDKNGKKHNGTITYSSGQRLTATDDAGKAYYFTRQGTKLSGADIVKA